MLFYQRKKFLVFTSELLRFSFMTGPYSLNPKMPIIDIFRKGLQDALGLNGIDSEKYFRNSTGLAIISKSHSGATAHLTTAKGDILNWISYDRITFPTVQLAMDF